ncbi:MAG: 3D domain-containing protein [Planctomycetota bacterium]
MPLFPPRSRRESPTARPRAARSKLRWPALGLLTLGGGAMIWWTLPTPVGGANRSLQGEGAPMVRVSVDAPSRAAASEDALAREALADAGLSFTQPQTQREVQAEPEPSLAIATPADPDIRYYDGRAIRPVRTIRMETTAYSPDEQSCGPFADGMTASGYSVWTNGMRLAAADTDVLPFGSILTVPGYNDERPIPVLDRGGAIKGQKLDLLYATHERALQWGRQKLDVTVWEYVDGE